MAMELMLEKWAGSVAAVKIGARKNEGGSRSKVITVGGEKTLPFLHKEAVMANKPVIALEIWDVLPVDWPDELVSAYGSALSDPFSWAEKCVKEYKADMLCVRLQAAHPEFGNKTAGDEAEFISDLLNKVDLPLIILGCGDDNKDNLVLPACSHAAKGQRCLIGSAVQDNYKVLTAAVMSDGHNIIAESPIDINIAKQLNILISDLGLDLERIVINPTIGALGYGLEYGYSIMERGRLAALAGDKALACPFICFAGQEAWKVKEAKISIEQMPAWGNQRQRGVIWEAVSAAALIQAGADILVMRHPKAAEKINEYINELMKK